MDQHWYSVCIFLELYIEIFSGWRCRLHGELFLLWCKTLYWLTVDFIWIDQVCMCMIEAMLTCVIYGTHVSSLILLDDGNAHIIGLSRL